MGLTELGVLLSVLSAYCLWFITVCMRTHFQVLIPFVHRIHMPNALSVITDEEHEVVHGRYDLFELRLKACNWGTFIAVTAALIFYAIQLYGGNATVVGYVMAVFFAFVIANYNLGSSTKRWCRSCENQVLARIIEKNADAGGFQSLGAYLESENQKMIQEWSDNVLSIGEEFEQRLKEIGFDEDYDYTQTPEDEQRLMEMLTQVQQEIDEKYPQPPEN